MDIIAPLQHTIARAVELFLHNSFLQLIGTGLATAPGLHFDINTGASLPLVAPSITSARTSIGALTIARWRVLAIVIGTLWAGSILIGLAYNMFVL